MNLPRHLQSFVEKIQPWDGSTPNPIVRIGTETKFGTVKGMRTQHGERYYFLEDEHGTVSFLPASLIEPE